MTDCKELDKDAFIKEGPPHFRMAARSTNPLSKNGKLPTYP